MSLLLDALKKAAEQKARKSKSSTADAEGNADETLLDVAADVAARAQPEEGSDDATYADETELDHSELSARLERSNVVRGSADETAFDETAIDQTSMDQTAMDETAMDETSMDHTSMDHTSMDETAIDETALDTRETTVIRTPADASGGFVEETEIVVPQQPSPDEDHRMGAGDDETMIITGEDETLLGRPGDAELTGIGKPADSEDVDQTVMNQPPGQDLTGISERSAGEAMQVERQRAAPREKDLWETDDTGLEVPDETTGREITDDDETVLAENFSEAASRVQPAPSGDKDETDFNQPPRRADEIQQAEVNLGARRPDDGGEEDLTQEPGLGADRVDDEDLSLLLIEPDPTNLRGGDTSITDPQALADRQRTLQAANELSLQDTTQSGVTQDATDTQAPTITKPSQNAVRRDETDTFSDLPHADATSTQTYAPDNYDRTLMKLPSDDESKLFAGMKSESDVVMTPDYAKKVFRSKTSAQRMQHLKAYLGIALVIVLAIGVYGGFQYQEEMTEIDNFLMPLKRDPMPGLIKPKTEENSDLFAASDRGATARTIEIIQAAEVEGDASEVAGETADSGDSALVSGSDSADTTVTQAQPEPADTVVEQVTTEPVETAMVDPVATEPAAADETVVASTGVSEQAPAPSQPAPSQPAVESDASDGGKLSVLTTSTPASADTGTSPASTLQILSSNEYRQNDLWLRDAYAAYLAGDDEKALRLYNQVLEVDPANRNALLARAAINVQNGNIDEAVRDYQALLMFNPKDSLAMSSLLAVAEYSPQEVESQLKLMIRDEPNSPYLNFALANAYGAQNRWQEAQRHYFTALQNNPQDPNYAYNLAVSLEHISQPGSAANYYRRALENLDSGLATFNPEVVNQRLAVLGQK